MRVAAALAGLALLAACVAEPPRAECGAAGLQGLVGRDKSVLAAMSLPPVTRVIEPWTAVTEDYNAQRLNIDVDARGRITGLWCG